MSVFGEKTKIPIGRFALCAAIRRYACAETEPSRAIVRRATRPCWNVNAGAVVRERKTAMEYPQVEFTTKHGRIRVEVQSATEAHVSSLEPLHVNGIAHTLSSWVEMEYPSGIYG